MIDHNFDSFCSKVEPQVFNYVAAETHFAIGVEHDQNFDSFCSEVKKHLDSYYETDLGHSERHFLELLKMLMSLEYLGVLTLAEAAYSF